LGEGFGLGLRRAAGRGDAMSDAEVRPLPHQKLVAWQVAVELLAAIKAAQITDSDLRDQAMRAGKSACLNIAEANGRQSQQDRKRVFSIARGELTEAAAAVELALTLEACRPHDAKAALAIASRGYGLLTGLIN